MNPPGLHCFPALLCGLLLAVGLSAAPVPTPRTWLYAAENPGKIMVLEESGKIIWEHPAELARDAWRLPNGNILFCYNRDYDSRRNDNPSGVLELTADRRVAFQFQTTGQVFSCQRLADGTTLVAAASQGRLLLADGQGKVVKTIQVRNTPGHSCMRYARALANGHFLVAEESARAVREYSAAGEMTREFKLDYPPFAAVRLPDGRTVISGKDSVVILDERGGEVWRLRAQELPDMGVRWFAGIQVLPDGNLFICNAGGKVAFFEVNPARKVVWQFDPGTAKVPLGHGIQRLDITGEPRK